MPTPKRVCTFISLNVVIGLNIMKVAHDIQNQVASTVGWSTPWYNYCTITFTFCRIYVITCMFRDEECVKVYEEDI